MNPLITLQQLRGQLPENKAENTHVREQMLVEARKLLLDLERPNNTVTRVGLQLIESVIIYTAVKMGLFKALNDSPSSTVADLAHKCKADPTFTKRILRCLVSNGAVQQENSDKFSPNQISKTFIERKGEVDIATYMGFLAPGWLALPEYLEERKWQNPNSQTDTSLAQGHNETNKTIWDLSTTRSTHAAFMEHMKHFSEGHKEWTDVYPIVERLGMEAGTSTEPDAVLMVDVGGGLGHQTVNTKRRFPELPGRFIVQDLAYAFPPPEMRSADVEYMEHDFAQEQPIKGARMYYLRFVIHDWPQNFNIELCGQLRKAMKPGYSKLVINEWILPEMEPSIFMTAMDISLMNAVGGMERTESEHRYYIERAGLKITKIFYPGDTISEAVIEAEVA